MRKYYDDYERGFKAGRKNALRESLGSPINITYDWAKSFLKKFTSKNFKLSTTAVDINLSGYVGRRVTHDIAFHFDDDEFNSLQISVEEIPHKFKSEGCAFYEDNGKLIKEYVKEFYQDRESLKDKYSRWLENDEEFSQICKEIRKIFPEVKF